MKKIFLYSFLLLCFNYARTQCGTGEIILRTQADVDNFSINYPSCHRILGNLTIESTDIDNLDGLSVIDTIDKFLLIARNQNLHNIHGLKNLVTVQDFVLDNCPLIEDLTALQSLQEASNSLYLQALPIPTFKGLERLKYVRQLIISGLPKLESFEGLDSLKKVQTLQIISNNNLENLKGFRSDLEISQFSIRSNEKLNSLHNFDLKQLYSLELRANPVLEDISGLSNLATLWFLNIVRNEKLKSLSAFSNLNVLNFHLRLEENPNLVDISGLKNIVPTTLDSIIIKDNKSLNVCHIESLCSFLGIPNSIARIQANAPDCIDRPTVESNCLKTSIKSNVSTSVIIYPVPVTDKLIIEGIQKNSDLQILSVEGKVMLSLKYLNSYQEIDLSNLATGLYLLKSDQKIIAKFSKI